MVQTAKKSQAPKKVRATKKTQPPKKAQAPKKAQVAKKAEPATGTPAFVLDRLYQVIESRRGAKPTESASARLFARGRVKICQKVGEEAVEVVVAALGESRGRVVEESADLFYYLTVLWADLGIRPEDVWKELEAREGKAGLDRRKRVEDDTGE